jgi:hypothetical protein
LISAEKIIDEIKSFYLSGGHEDIVEPEEK